MPIVGIRGLLALDRAGIGELIQQFFVLQSLQGFGRAMEDEDRSLAPTHYGLLPGLNLADIEVDGPALGERRSVRVQLIDERNEGRGRTYGGNRPGRDVQEVPSRRRAWARLGHAGRRGCAVHNSLLDPTRIGAAPPGAVTLKPVPIEKEAARIGQRRLLALVPAKPLLTQRRESVYSLK